MTRGLDRASNRSIHVSRSSTVSKTARACTLLRWPPASRRWIRACQSKNCGKSEIRPGRWQRQENPIIGEDRTPANWRPWAAGTASAKCLAPLPAQPVSKQVSATARSCGVLHRWKSSLVLSPLSRRRGRLSPIGRCRQPAASDRQGAYRPCLRHLSSQGARGSFAGAHSLPIALSILLCRSG